MNGVLTMEYIREIMRMAAEDDFYRQLAPLPEPTMLFPQPVRKYMGSEIDDELSETVSKLVALVELQHGIIELLVKLAKHPNSDMRETMFAEIDDIEKKMQETIDK